MKLLLVNAMKPFLYSLYIIICCYTMLWAGPAVNGTTMGPPATAPGARPRGDFATMPKQCRTGKTSPEAFGWRWNPDTLVRVYYLKGSFSQTEAAALSRAVNNWNNALKEIGAGIAFAVGGERENVVREAATITVVRGEPQKSERLGELRFYSAAGGVSRATLTIRPVVTDPDALTSMMTHEMGHTLGLADCYQCRRGTTAMSAFKDENKGNDVYEPSACDKYVVAAGYAAQAVAQEARIIPAERK